ncbi:hypothetical protein FA10DRAFT_268186 [Acaromyces ingoldii]|uniref:Pescadillo homolog n=1 Tax=Acaromyces ingoldii TaxID=215250 RepID=A0A316YLI3_9BASI|nr:hypothetical protein FA10DRAFT_268186 [Acaromyces ingoldii]PWN89664.1 hypothetical protein FA10DRAFT_268186 [Acaromyces ingoldii]
MAKIKKRGQSGAAKNYVTRSQALKRLQITLADFRRLCILKGIFPRQPRNSKKANKGSSAPTSFYYAKDIAYLAHEPVLGKLREHKSFAKKLSRAVGRREWALAQNLKENEPVYRLDHIIKQRYPTFDDSLRDLDDSLSLLTLFANLPSQKSVKADTVERCSRLCAQWQLYVIRSRCLQKVFLSIKGVYFQAEVRGQTITWLVPYLFTQYIPADVDFRIMSTFLELYQTLLGFVLYKLYTDMNLVYPPHFDESQDEQAAGFGALRLTEAGKAALDGLGGEGQGGAKGRLTNGAAAAGAKKVSAREVREQIQAIAKSAPAQDDQEVGQDEEEEREAAAQVQAQGQEEPDEDFTEQPSKSVDQASAGPSLTTLAQLDSSSSNSVQNTLFAPYYFYISRECPRGMLEFVLRCFGASSAQIGWDSLSGGAGSAFDESDERITHHIVDRPPHARFTREHGGKRAYVQPQWVVDCVNAKKLLATGPYEPGKTLPPHLSPFVDNEAVKRRGGYVPAEAREVQESMQEDEEQGESADEDDDEEEEEEGADRQAADEEENPMLSALLADPTNTELLSAAELEAEQAGGEDALGALHRAHEAALKRAGHGKKTSSTAKKGAEDADEEEAKKMAKMLMSNKQRKLYNKVSLGAGRRGEERERLERKKMALQKDKAKATKKKV